jgi:hypothetical protein
VYEPGQFFRRHRDSEKADAMVGTLVVTLPSVFKGGTLTIEHRGESVSFRGSRRSLSFVAFYADCEHEVRPVTEGYRITLTYNLVVVGAAVAVPDSTVVPAVSDRLREHFTTPLPARWVKNTSDRHPPNRLVFLLDHEYTERGFRWDRLKGEDAERAAVLLAAAERAECVPMLALAEIQETRDVEEFDRSYRHRRWDYDYDDTPPVSDALGELLASEISLACWLDRDGHRADTIVGEVTDDEVCAATPTSELRPYNSEYEGYMGNYGNTMDRWYRRAAIVVWPRDKDFAVRAAASAGWASAELERRLRTDGADECRALVESMLPFWPAVAGRDGRKSTVARALRVARAIEAPAPAAALVAPFGVEMLTRTRAKELAGLHGTYGDQWFRDLLSGWADDRRAYDDQRSRLDWVAMDLPDLCATLSTLRHGDLVGLALLDVIVWPSLRREVEWRSTTPQPDRLRKLLMELPTPLCAALVARHTLGVRAQTVAVMQWLRPAERDTLLPLLVQTLRIAADRDAAGIPELRDVARYCATRLPELLAEAQRAADDWSLTLPGDCRCALCVELAAFLADKHARTYEWPLAKDKRQYVHSRIDRFALPVSHDTRRVGRPFTLVLTKTAELHERETRQRREWQADLDWLGQAWHSATNVGG